MSAVVKETSPATTKLPNSTGTSLSASLISVIPAANAVIVMARRKENREAAPLSRPRSSQAVIVALEREAPGISATACAHPISNASLQVIDSTVRLRAPA